jgi:hypothetical protein
MSTAAIDHFRGPNRFLSNFWIEPGGRSNEHYFQACKTQDKQARKIILNAEKPRDAKWLGSKRGMLDLSKRLGREITLREDWDEVCDAVMRWGLRRKFEDPELRAKLLATGDAKLTEGNDWCDLRWGVCECPEHNGKGENRLGLMLMELRDELHEEAKGMPAPGARTRVSGLAD